MGAFVGTWSQEFSALYQLICSDALHYHLDWVFVNLIDNTQESKQAFFFLLTAVNL